MNGKYGGSPINLSRYFKNAEVNIMYKRFPPG